MLKRRKVNESTLFISHGQDSKSAVTDLYFLSQIIYDKGDSIFIPVNESAKGFSDIELSIMIQTKRSHHSSQFP